MNIKYITSGLLAAMIVNCTAFLTSYADDLEVGKRILMSRRTVAFTKIMRICVMESQI